MAQGKVKTVTDRGYGFITSDASDKDIFYHEQSLTGDLKDRKLRVGDVVTFEVEQTDRGLNATDIELVEN